MITPISISATSAHAKFFDSKSLHRVTSANTDEAPPANAVNGVETRSAYTVTLSTLAKVRALKLSGSDASVIAAELGLTTADVESTLDVKMDRSVPPGS